MGEKAKMKILFSTKDKRVVCGKCETELTGSWSGEEADGEEDYWCNSCMDYVQEKLL